MIRRFFCTTTSSSLSSPIALSGAATTRLFAASATARSETINSSSNSGNRVSASTSTSSGGSLNRPFLAQQPAAQLLRDAAEQRREITKALRWIDITNALPAALATREADSLLACIFEKMAVEGQQQQDQADKLETPVEDLLTLDTACGLLQVTQFADIESRATELFERAAAVESLKRHNNHHYHSDVVRAQSRGLALYLSNGSIPLSMRQRCSDGASTLLLLRRFLLHPAFLSKPTEQAILIDAAGKVLERLAPTTLAPEAVCAFRETVASSIRRWFLHAELEAATRNESANAEEPLMDEDGKPQQQEAAAAAAADAFKIFSAERTMMREAWRRLQRNVRRNGNVGALAITVDGELQHHLKLVAVGTPALAPVVQKQHHEKDCDDGTAILTTVPVSATFIATLSGQELTDAELDELSLFDFHCAVDAMHFCSSLLLSSLLPSHPHKKSNGSSFSESINSSGGNNCSNIISLPQLQRTVAITDRIRSACPVDSPEWLSLRDAVTVTNLLARHSIETLYGTDMGLNIIFRDLVEKQLFDVTGARKKQQQSSSSSLLSDDSPAENNEQQQQQQEQGTAMSETDKKESILAQQLEQDLLAEDDEEDSPARKAATEEDDDGKKKKDDDDASGLFLAAGNNLCVTNRFGDPIVDKSMRAVLLIAALHLLKAKDTSFEDAIRAEVLLQCVVKYHFPRGTNLQQLRHTDSSSYSSATSAAASVAASFNASSNTTNEEGGDFDPDNSSVVGGGMDSAAQAHASSFPSVSTPAPDYDLLQHAHVAVVRGLCDSTTATSSSASSDSTAARPLDGASAAYSLISAHKYYGVRVTSKMLLPMLSQLSARGDSRVFNAVDVCALFSGSPVTDDVLCEALKTCAVAGDHHRARVLMQLLRSDVPGILMKLPDEAIEALQQLDVVPKVAGTFFDPEKVAGEKGVEAVESECLPLMQQQAQPQQSTK